MKKLNKPYLLIFEKKRINEKQIPEFKCYQKYFS